MAVERDTADSGFGEVSRIKGIAFRYLSFGASVIGILALAALLVYVFVDAFDLANASPEWLLTYFLTLVAPFIGFCLYSAGDRELLGRTVLALGGGLLGTAVAFEAIELLVRPIPRLTWPVAYLFVVAVPVVGYVLFAGAQKPVGRTGFGLLGRPVGGATLGTAVAMLFIVFDMRLWFLVYTLGIFPAGLVRAYGGLRGAGRLAGLSVPIGVVGVVAAAFLRNVIRTYPTSPLIFAWTFGVPIAFAAATLVGSRGASRESAAAVGVVSLVAAGLGTTLGSSALPDGSTVLVLAATVAPTATYLHRTVESGEGLSGLALPVLLGGGALAGAAIVGAFGIPAPDPWLDPGFVTEAPSRNAVEAGLYPAIVGSVIIIAIVALLSFVLGVGAAVFLEEYTADTGIVGGITRIIQINIANLAAVPSVVYGLLGLGLFANLLGFGFGTAVTASLTLSLLILPITVISAQEAIRSVPNDLRQASYGMGATRWQTTKNVVLPEALPGILTGTILALGRAIGETAPLIMIGAATTVFSAPNDVWSRFSAMPMQIFAWSDFPQAEFRYGVVAAGVVTLLIVLLSMNATAIIIRNKMERGT
ncbi:phosphate ABC transporter permease PstA [Natronomonas sp. LN261]|uniref:phosphate ABC transporter permease PstA n=1 Tax=Natronomonas sp. LN261 TaxID=2750669 RepID=UPI0015EF042E|nr:phosphate ABC transporter permease PstA [Natronomonas sp. LN261]